MGPPSPPSHTSQAFPLAHSQHDPLGKKEEASAASAAAAAAAALSAGLAPKPAFLPLAPNPVDPRKSPENSSTRELRRRCRPVAAEATGWEDGVAAASTAAAGFRCLSRRSKGSIGIGDCGSGGTPAVASALQTRGE